MEDEDFVSDDEDWLATDWDQSLPVSLGATPGSSKAPNTGQGQAAAAKTSGAEDQSQLMSRMQLNDNKAGMEGLDKERINQIIYENSKGSKYFENERKKEEQVKRRVEEQKLKQQKITQEQLWEGESQADLLLESLERSRDLSQTIVHVDMDAFFAAVEIRDKPELRDVPMAVGGSSMLSTSNYHARKFGVRAAMPGFIGKKLCPDLVIVHPNFNKYTEVSREIRVIFSDYDPNFCPLSLDEAYLNLTRHLEKRQNLSAVERSFLVRESDPLDASLCQCDLNLVHPQSSAARSGVTEKEMQEADSQGLVSSEEDLMSVLMPGDACIQCGQPIPPFHQQTFGLDAEEAVMEMRCRIEQRTRLTASAGIAPNRMLAKVCSDRNKPNGQYRIPPDLDTIRAFIRDLPIRKISGVGKVTETMLKALEVTTCHDLFVKRGLLYHLYSAISFNYFMRITLGIGDTSVERDGERKSMSTERTFGELWKPAELQAKCQELCEALAEDMVEEELKGKTVTLKIKTVHFEVRTRAHTLAAHTNDLEVILAAAQEILRSEIQACHPQPLRLRLMGVRMSNLLHQSLCPVQRQETITSFLSRASSSTASTSSSSSATPAITAKAKSVTDPVPVSQAPPSLPAFPSATSDLQSLDPRVDDDDDAEGRKCDEASLDHASVKGNSSPSKTQANKITSFLTPVPQTSLKTSPVKTSPMKTSPMKTQASSPLKQMKVEGFFARASDERDGGSGVETVSKIETSPKGKDDLSRSLEGRLEVSPNSASVTEPVGGSLFDTVKRHRRGRKTGGASGSTGSAPDSDSKEAMSCPVCQKQLPFQSLARINKHIDSCLAQGAKTTRQGKHSRAEDKAEQAPSDVKDDGKDDDFRTHSSLKKTKQEPRSPKLHMMSDDVMQVSEERVENGKDTGADAQRHVGKSDQQNLLQDKGDADHSTPTGGSCVEEGKETAGSRARKGKRRSRTSWTTRKRSKRSSKKKEIEEGGFCDTVPVESSESKGFDENQNVKYACDTEIHDETLQKHCEKALGTDASDLRDKPAQSIASTSTAEISVAPSQDAEENRSICDHQQPQPQTSEHAMLSIPPSDNITLEDSRYLQLSTHGDLPLDQRDSHTHNDNLNTCQTEPGEHQHNTDETKRENAVLNNSDEETATESSFSNSILGASTVTVVDETQLDFLADAGSTEVPAGHVMEHSVLEQMESASVDGAEEGEEFTCPVCRATLPACSLDRVNEHLDTCLSRGTIREIVQEENIKASCSQPVKKRPLSLGKSSQPATKKKKNIATPPKTRTIASFFQPK